MHLSKEESDAAHASRLRWLADEVDQMANNRGQDGKLYAIARMIRRKADAIEDRAPQKKDGDEA